MVIQVVVGLHQGMESRKESLIVPLETSTVGTRKRKGQQNAMLR